MTCCLLPCHALNVQPSCFVEVSCCFSSGANCISHSPATLGISRIRGGDPATIFVDPWQPPTFNVLPHDLPCPIAEQPGRYEGQSDAFGVRPTLGMNTALILPCDMQHACTDGVTLLELFGGLSAGLEMFLACGPRV